MALELPIQIAPLQPGPLDNRTQFTSWLAMETFRLTSTVKYPGMPVQLVEQGQPIKSYCLAVDGSGWEPVGVGSGDADAVQDNLDTHAATASMHPQTAAALGAPTTVEVTGMLSFYVPNAQKGAANGVVPLNASQQIDTQYINTSALATGSWTIVADIDARNALGYTGATSPRTVYVINATGDATVSSGWATYLWNPNTLSFIKTGEQEGLDLTIAWGMITGIPGSFNPAAHATNLTTYGVASATNYGHVRVVDNLTTQTQDALSANQGYVLAGQVTTHAGVGATTSVVGHVQLTTSLASTSSTLALAASAGKTLSDNAAGHAGTAASTTVAGHVQLVNDLVTNDATKAATAAQVYALDQNKSPSAHTHSIAVVGTAGYMPALSGDSAQVLRGDGSWGVVSLAWGSLSGVPSSFTPSAHATTLTTYGVASSTNYGHVRVLDNLTSQMATTDALSAAQGYALSQTLGTHSSAGATTAAAGHVQLDDTLISTSVVRAATANVAKQLKDAVDEKAPKTRVVTTINGLVALYPGETVSRVSGVLDDPLDDKYYDYGGIWRKEGL